MILGRIIEQVSAKCCIQEQQLHFYFFFFFFFFFDFGHNSGNILMILGRISFSLNSILFA